jgi:predicted  nucleic acid-binding Zn-ribbon protein
MPDPGLARLYRLHVVDSALHDLKSRAGALDTGQAEKAELKAYMAETESVRAQAKKLSTDLKDLELEAASLQAKKAKFDKQLFDGSVTTSREAENVQKEIAMIGELIDKIEGREIEILDALPPVQKEAQEYEAHIEELQKAVVRKHKKAVEDQELIKAAYAEKLPKRAPLAKDVPEPLLKVYEALRPKLGVAMALVTEDHRCSVCGMHTPDKAVEMIRHDRVVQCEQCRRILFSPIPSL